MYFEFQQNARSVPTWAPTVDVCERASEIVIFIELPGVERNDIELSWSDGVVVVTGVKRQKPPDNRVAHYLCLERAYGHFRREISINVPVNHAHAKAFLEDGLMRIHLPKLVSRSDTGKIPIL